MHQWAKIANTFYSCGHCRRKQKRVFFPMYSLIHAFKICCASQSHHPPIQRNMPKGHNCFLPRSMRLVELSQAREDEEMQVRPYCITPSEFAGNNKNQGQTLAKRKTAGRGGNFLSRDGILWRSARMAGWTLSLPLGRELTGDRYRKWCATWLISSLFSHNLWGDFDI